MKIKFVILFICFFCFFSCKKSFKDGDRTRLTNLTGTSDNLDLSKVLRSYVNDSFNVCTSHPEIVTSYNSKAIFPDSNNWNSYTLNLLKNNKYNLVATNESRSSDLVYTFSITEGTYKDSNRDIVCTDDLFGYKLIFKKGNSVLIAKTIFSNLVGIRFVLYKYNEKYDYSFVNRLNISTIRQLNMKYNHSSQKLLYGVYGERLRLIHPNFYEYYNEKMTLSRGRFFYNAKTNELRLWDSVLNHIWNLYFVSKNKLIDVQGSMCFYEDN